MLDLSKLNDAVRHEGGVSRRLFLAYGAALASLPLLGTRASAATRPTTFPADPFALGVASGDPDPTGVVLWTRLAPAPLDPAGGMKPLPVDVRWEVADDDGMRNVVRSGTAVATPQLGHSVHVEVDGLRPDRWYFYRFRAGDAVSPVGRTRTLPDPAAAPGELRFAFASCQHYEAGLFTAYERMAKDELDLILHLGDYIYEKGPSDTAVRKHNSPEVISLDDYRNRYAQYRSDPALQAAHAMAPWIVTWDDHEVSNNYAGAISEHPDRTTTEQFLLRRAAGYQAYFEHMPLRRTALPKGPDMLLYRRLNFGRLASFHVLDTRQYRTDQPQGDGLKPPSPVLMDPAGTLMGERQRDWLFTGLEKSPATWNVLAQQIMMARVDAVPGPEVGYSMDKWSGYEFERRRLLRHFHDRRVSNPIVLSGDIHNNWANELIADFDQLDSQSVAVEFVGTSISSGGDGSDRPKQLDELLSENPFVKFHNDERGYVHCEVTPEGWRSDYRTVPYVTRQNAPLNTRASFHVEAGRPKLQRA